MRWKPAMIPACHSSVAGYQDIKRSFHIYVQTPSIQIQTMITTVTLEHKDHMSECQHIRSNVNWLHYQQVADTLLITHPDVCL